MDKFPTFTPHALLRSGFAMTVFGSWPRRGFGSFAARSEERILEVDEGTRIRIQLDRPPGAPDGPRSALVILHGLVGSSEAVYSLGLARAAAAQGFLVARMNARNCGGTEHLTRAPYNGAETDDLAAVAHHLVEAEGVECVHLAGFSVGGNQTLRLAARWGASAPGWLGSVSVTSPCVDFAASADVFRSAAHLRLIERRFLRRLIALVRRRHELHGMPSLAGIDQIRTIRQFDDRFTAPLSGYAGADDYYRRASMVGRLGELLAPTLILAARDDPLVPVKAFVGAGVKLGAGVRLEVTRHGGHVAFVSNRPARWEGGSDPDPRWAEHRILQFARLHDPFLGTQPGVQRSPGAGGTSVR